MQLDAAFQVADALEVLGAGPANDAMNLVALFQQQIGEVGAVLASDACNQCFFHDLP